MCTVKKKRRKKKWLYLWEDKTGSSGFQKFAVKNVMAFFYNYICKLRKYYVNILLVYLSHDNLFFTIQLLTPTLVTMENNTMHTNLPV